MKNQLRGNENIMMSNRITKFHPYQLISTHDIVDIILRKT